MSGLRSKASLIENPSTHVAFASSTMSETDFIRAIARRTGCGLLLDVNNVFVSATNHGYAAFDYLSDFPLAEVGEIHLAGHAEQSDDEGERLLIDNHDGSVADAVWKLYEIVISRCDCIPTLIEWDSKIPAWPILRAEAAAAQAILDRAWKIDEPLFLPPMVGDFVAKDHLARFVLSLVRDDLGLGEITGTYGSQRGQPPFDPTMMTVLLLYSYCCGIYTWFTS